MRRAACGGGRSSRSGGLVGGCHEAQSRLLAPLLSTQRLGRRPSPNEQSPGVDLGVEYHAGTGRSLSRQRAELSLDSANIGASCLQSWSPRPAQGVGVRGVGLRSQLVSCRLPIRPFVRRPPPPRALGPSIPRDQGETAAELPTDPCVAIVSSPTPPRRVPRYQPPPPAVLASLSPP